MGTRRGHRGDTMGDIKRGGKSAVTWRDSKKH